MEVTILEAANDTTIGFDLVPGQGFGPLSMDLVAAMLLVSAEHTTSLRVCVCVIAALLRRKYFHE